MNATVVYITMMTCSSHSTPISMVGTFIRVDRFAMIHRRLYGFLGSLAVLAVVLCATSAANTASDASGTVDLLGTLTEAQLAKVTVPNHGMVIRVNRHLLKEQGRLSPRENYYILAKQVDAVEGEMLADAMDGQWNSFGQLEAALIAEGIRDAAKIRLYEARVATMVQEMRETYKMTQEGGADTAISELAKQVFQYLHTRVLTGRYDIDCSELSHAFDRGDYNCVSATLLFNVLAERMGLVVTAVEKPGHVLSRVALGAEAIEIETTCANWFSLPSSEARLAVTLAKTASAVSPTGELLTAEAAKAFIVETRSISSVQLVAMIYYNLGVDYINTKKYDLATAANAKALLLDGESQTAWSNLMATLNNWAIDFATSQKRYDLAARLLDEGRILDATYSNFEANQLHVYYHWIELLLGKGRTADAKTVYQHANKHLPGNAALARLVQSAGL